MNTPSTSWLRRSLVASAVLAMPIALADPALACGADSLRRFSGPLQDLQSATVEPLDGAHARLTMSTGRGSGSTFALTVTGIDRAARGHEFGAHLHVGPCVAGAGAAAGPHYNQSALNGDVPPLVNDETEVWLDFTVTASGRGHAVAHVPFVPSPGAHSVVIHRDATDAHGTAGPRLACLPVVW